MSGEHLFEDKGNVKPKPKPHQLEPDKDSGAQANQEGGLMPSHLQRTAGNAAVQRFVAQRQGAGPAELDEETTKAIQRKRGDGQALDAQVAERAGETLDRDFADVRVHTDKEADELSRQLGAKAFTIGSDIFFKEGAYEPGSQSGQSLISHELTHVVQQEGGDPDSSSSFRVNDPHDQHEAEADKVAQKVTTGEASGVQRAAAPEEEEEIQTKAEEEEEIQMK